MRAALSLRIHFFDFFSRGKKRVIADKVQQAEKHAAALSSSREKEGGEENAIFFPPCVTERGGGRKRGTILWSIYCKKSAKKKGENVLQRSNNDIWTPFFSRPQTHPFLHSMCSADARNLIKPSLSFFLRYFYFCSLQERGRKLFEVENGTKALCLLILSGRPGREEEIR